MKKLTIYEKPTCSTCRVAIGVLNDSGRAYERVRYYDEPLSAKKLLELMRKSGLPLDEFVRTKESAWKAMGKKVEDFTPESLAALLATDPDLIQRPILECGDRVTVGRPVERIGEFLKECK